MNFVRNLSPRVWKISSNRVSKRTCAAGCPV